MKNKKHAFRIGTILCILSFLLIPLLSSPVAAATFDFDLGTAWTDNTPGAPNTGLTPGDYPPGTHWESDATPRTVDFIITFDFTDSSGNTQKPSSRHYGEIEVFKNPSGPRQSDSTGVIYLNDGGSFTTILTISDTYTAQELTVHWDVMVYVECYDIPTQTRASAIIEWDFFIA